MLEKRPCAALALLHTRSGIGNRPHLGPYFENANLIKFRGCSLVYSTLILGLEMVFPGSLEPSSINQFLEIGEIRV